MTGAGCLENTMRDFYTQFYSVAEYSQAHHIFCEKVFGMDLGQHGFADLEQLHLLMEVSGLGRQQHILDLGCGNGTIAEYLSDHTGAQVTGLDFIPEAIHQARLRTATKAGRLDFMVGDINHLDLSAQAFDVIFSIDSIYFSEDYTLTIRELKAALKQGGEMAFLYSYGREPWVPVEEFPREKLAADKTPLAEALAANEMVFKAWKLTQQDYALAQRRKEVLVELREQFQAEGADFIYDNRMSDANGIMQAVEEGLHARYLYCARGAPAH
jgi:ubiquinone/menaquinone biosynthesis C-methylase UbiE